MSFSVLAMELWIVNVDVVESHPSKVKTRSKSSTGIINFNVAKGMIFYHSTILRSSMASFFQTFIPTSPYSFILARLSI